MTPDFEIASVSDAISYLHSFESSNEFGQVDNLKAHYRFPFGFWFRGQAAFDWELHPSINRIERGFSALNETRLFNNFRLRASDNEGELRSTFEWLCLMQHYGLPTRILDWSENVLIALYFATENQDHYDSDGALYLMNAPRLNSISNPSKNSTIYTPEDFECIARAEFSRTSRLSHFRSIKAFKESYFFDDEWKPTDENISAMCGPVAVFPHRRNMRMLLQSSVFTVHGGKLFSYSDGDELPKPRSIEEINSTSNNKYLAKLRIPASRKERIARQLEIIGIHRGALFPELDSQSSFVCKQWSVPTIETDA